MGTLLIGLVLFGVVVLIFMKVFRDIQKGKCAGCSCSCEFSNSFQDCDSGNTEN